MIDTKNRRPHHTFLRACGIALALALSPLLPSAARASDHGDTDRLIAAGRHDARIADFYIFTRGENLVLVMTIVGATPEPTPAFRFGGDVTYRFLIDRAAAVTFDDAEQTRLFGGTITDPASIHEDVVIEVRFGADGSGLTVSATGLHPSADTTLSAYAGIRDEPFIRSTVIGLNIAAIVVELPLRRVVAETDAPILLAWATTDVANLEGDQDELGGRAYRSMFRDGQGLNTLHPSLHTSTLSVAPDVVIFDTSRPAAFPNGRDLVDDVVDLLGRPDGEPYPSTNDVPFSDAFPYLAPPHARPAPSPAR